MPYALEITSTYEKRLLRFFKRHRDVVSKYRKTIRLLELDPFHPSLRLHRPSGRLKDLYSVSIDLRYRITMAFFIEDQRIVPVNIGTHDEVYGTPRT